MKYDINVVFVKGSPYPYLMHKEVNLLNGSKVNATSLDLDGKWRGGQYCTWIPEHEVVRMEKITINLEGKT